MQEKCVCLQRIHRDAMGNQSLWTATSQPGPFWRDWGPLLPGQNGAVSAHCWKFKCMICFEPVAILWISWVVLWVNMIVTIFSFEYGFQTPSAGPSWHLPWVPPWNSLKTFKAQPCPGELDSLVRTLSKGSWHSGEMTCAEDFWRYPGSWLAGFLIVWSL